MNRYMLKLQTQEEIVNFVNMMGKSDCNADLKCGSIIVDACSLLGVISIGLNKLTELITYGDPGDEFKENISKYCVA